MSNIKLPESFIERFNLALKEGLENTNLVVLNYKENDISKEMLENYITKSISYLLDDNKQKAIQKFLNYVKMREVLTSES